MKTTETFADRANKIIKKYPYASNSKTDNDSMMDELEALSAEQEAMKKAQEEAQATKQAQGGNELFGDGGYTDILKALGTMGGVNTLASNYGNTLYEDNKKMGILPLDAVPLSKEEQRREKQYEKEFGSDVTDGVMPTATSSKLKESFKENPEDYYNVLSGLAPASANIANLMSVGKPKMVTPSHYKPSLKPTFFNSEPIEAKLQQNLASASYNMSKQGGDFDSYTASLMKVNEGTNEALGQTMMEGQKLNMAEQGRIDKAVSDANLINTTADNQAKVDYHQEGLDKAQLRRDYRGAIGENVGGLFADMADSSLAKKMGVEWEKMAKLLATSKT